MQKYKLLNLLCKTKFILILISLFLISCEKEKKTDEILVDKFWWQPGISAPKYYPVGECVVDFGSAGNGTRMPFNSGWGNSYGSVVSGDRYKEAPKEVFIKYNSGVENYLYQGKVLLPQERIRSLFEKYNLDKEDNSGDLVVGMAPGGWIRVWFHTLDEKTNDLVNIEVAKAQLKGSYDDTADERYKVKNFENWGKYYTYWQLHGIPYEAWANNEKEYDMYFDLFTPNHDEVEYSYVSEDGTFEQGIGIDKKFHQKLPVEFELGWRDKTKETFYCSKFIMPKNFKHFVEQKKINTIIFKLEIDKNDQDATLYLVVNNTKEKILRYKNKIPTAEEKKNNDYSYATEVEYFIK